MSLKNVCNTKEKIILEILKNIDDKKTWYY